MMIVKYLQAFRVEIARAIGIAREDERDILDLWMVGKLGEDVPKENNRIGCWKKQKQIDQQMMIDKIKSRPKIADCPNFSTQPTQEIDFKWI